MHIRRGRPKDLDSLLALEASCFEQERRDSKKVLRHSLSSPHQEVWVVVGRDKTLGCLFLRFHPETCRVHSIAVDPGTRGSGLGKSLLELARKRAQKRGCHRIHLEADANNTQLIEWYQDNGYHVIAKLSNYYAKGWHAYRLVQPIRL